MNPSRDIYSEFFERSRYDVRYWNEVVFGNFEPPWEKQWDIWESVVKNRRTTCRSGYGVGKSHIAARIAIWFLHTFYPSVVFTTAPTGRQVDSVLWGEIRRQHRASLINLGGKVYDGKPKLFLDHDWYAMGFTTRQRSQGEDIGSLFQGFHSLHVLFIIDEAAGVDDEVFESAESVCTTEHSRILAIGNPTDPGGQFARTFKAPPANSLGGWNKIKISVLDSPNVKAGRNVIPKLTSYDWPEDRKAAWGEESPMYVSKVLAEFPELGTDTLIPLKFIEEALQRDPSEVDSSWRGRSLGVDVARFGDDMTVGYELNGCVTKRRFRMALSSIDETAARIGTILNDEHFDRVNIDEDGIGSGVIDILRSQEYMNINGIQGGAAPTRPDKYYNRRTEIAFALRERFIHEKNICLDEEDTGAQLSSLKYRFTTRGGYSVYQLEKKEETKKRLGRSPDDADALIYANANAGVKVEGDIVLGEDRATANMDW